MLLRLIRASGLPRPVLIAVGVALSCSGPAPQPTVDVAEADAALPTRDAGTDVGRLDASHDAARDADHDAGTETTWTRIATSLPDVCVIERADHPEAMESLRLRWAPCASSDCRVSDPLGDSGTAGWDGTDGEYVIGRWDAPGHRVVVVVPIDGGPVLAAFRSGPLTGRATHCHVGTAALAEGRAAFTVDYADGGVRGAAFWLAPTLALASIDEPFLDDRTTFSDDFPQRIYVGSGAVVVDAQPINLLFEISTGVPVPVFVTADPGATFASTHAVGDQIFWDAYPAYIARGRAGERGGQEYVRPAPPWEVSEMRTDGRDLVWLTSHVTGTTPEGSELRDFELWTGRLTEDPASFVPRRVRTLDTWGNVAFGDGIWVVRRGVGTAADPGRLELYDIADGRRRVFVPSGLEIVPDVWPALEVTRERVTYGTTGARTRLVQFDPRPLPYAVE